MLSNVARDHDKPSEDPNRASSSSPPSLDWTADRAHPPLRAARRKNTRSIQACDHCRRSKVRCDGLLPCKRCIGKHRLPPIDALTTPLLPLMLTSDGYWQDCVKPVNISESLGVVVAYLVVAAERPSEQKSLHPSNTHLQAVIAPVRLGLLHRYSQLFIAIMEQWPRRPGLM